MKNNLLHLTPLEYSSKKHTFKSYCYYQGTRTIYCSTHMDEDEHKRFISLINNYTKIIAISPHRFPTSKKYWNQCLLQDVADSSVSSVSSVRIGGKKRFSFLGAGLAQDHGHCSATLTQLA